MYSFDDVWQQKPPALIVDYGEYCIDECTYYQTKVDNNPLVIGVVRRWMA
jgi:hypothetical protein